MAKDGGRDDEDREHREERDRGPGAHSGQEAEAQPRRVPGEAGVTEGYSRGGTGAGEPLKGVRADEAESDGDDSDDSDDSDDERRGGNGER